LMLYSIFHNTLVLFQQDFSFILYIENKIK
jgi:hypothetical protein